MSGLEFTSSVSYVLPSGEEFAYGIEQIEIKKHVWTAGQDVLRGAVLHDPSNGKRFFVTEADLARYARPLPAPDAGLLEES